MPVRDPFHIVAQTRHAAARTIAAAFALALLCGPQPAAAASADCAKDALTCVAVTGHPGKTSGWQPVTFGQPFRRGSVPKGAVPVARDSKGNALSLQLDAQTTYDDGSLRFAVLSTELPNMSDGETRTVNLYVPAGSAPTVPAPQAAQPAPFDLSVAIDVYSPEMEVVKFGDRTADKPGTPFTAGEKITLKVGTTAPETFTLTVTPKMSGGRADNYRAISRAFAELINTQSKHYTGFYQTTRYNIVRIASVDQKERFDVTPVYSGKAAIEVSTYSEQRDPERFVAHYTGSERGKPWLNGAVAREQDILLPLVSAATGKQHPLLSARVHLRRYTASGAVRADVIIGNDWAFADAPSNVTYNVRIVRNSETVYSRQAITHYHHSRWHRVVWSEGRAEPDVRHNIPYFLSSTAVLHYDANLRITGDIMDRDFRSLDDANTAPMGTGTVTAYMPTTGERGDIGPLPTWATKYLLTMDPRERAVTFANADAGASIPIHYRDQKTDLPLSIDDHPTATLDPKTRETGDPADRLPDIVLSDTPWTAQTAHHPSLFYVPYLVSGDLFYLEEVQFWSNWIMLNKRPVFRGRDQGLIWASEVRGQAWALRTVGEAAVITPDAHPMKAYFEKKLLNNIDWYLNRYPRNPDKSAVSPLGIIERPDAKGQSGPWQEDYMFLVVGHLAEMGVPGSEEFLRWLAKFSVGRWLAEDQGYCHEMAPAYYIKTRYPDGRFIDNWKDLFHTNWPKLTSCPAKFVTSGAYIAHAYGVLGLAADFNIHGAREAQIRLAREAPGMMENNADIPHFAVVPRN